MRTWVLGIVHHRAIDALRRATVHDRRRASDEGIEERFEARERTDVEAARREEAGAVRGALSSLPADQSQVIELAYFGGFTHTEIADMLDAPVGTVKGRMRLGLKKMRRSSERVRWRYERSRRAGTTRRRLRARAPWPSPSGRSSRPT